MIIKLLVFYITIEIERWVIKLQKKILTVNNLKKYFSTSQGIVKAVDGISFSMNEGEIFGLVGESGSGKSTVAYTIVGMHTPTEGEILYREKALLNKGMRQRPLKLKKEIQIIFQDPGTSLNPARTVQQILELPIRVHKIAKSKKEILEKIKELLKIVQLPQEYLYKFPAMIGGGEKQLISIARALAVKPSFIILDEPTSALDVSIQAKTIRMILKFKEEFNLSYLFITHDLSLMRNVADRIGIMYLGKICEIASVEEFFKNPLHPYTQMLLSSIPVISDEEKKFKPKGITIQGEIPSAVNIPIGCGFNSRCPKKMDICNQKDPKFIKISENHLVRCHLFS